MKLNIINGARKFLPFLREACPAKAVRRDVCRTEGYTFNKLLTLLILLFLFSCQKEETPTGGNKIEMGGTSSSAVSYFSATVSSTPGSVKGNTITQHGHCWSTVANPTIQDNKTALGSLSEAKTFTSQLENLQNNTNYFVRSYLTTEYETIYGNETNLKTLETTKPAVSTSAISDRKINSAVSGGNVTTEGGYPVTARGIVWNTTGNPSIESNHGKTKDGTSIGSFTSQLTELQDGTTYYVRAYATNSKGTGYGDDIDFTTLKITLPTVSTSEITGITETSAQGGGNVTSDGNADVTSRGIVWNTTGNPSLESNLGKTTNETGTGSFISLFSGLTKGTTHYVRAYAVNSAGTAYGNPESFETLVLSGTFTDSRDDNTYNFISIGTQTLMAENLAYLPSVSVFTAESNTEPYYYVYGYQGTSVSAAKATTNYGTYGVLYNWPAAMNGATSSTTNPSGVQGICPSGWHLPSDAEWSQLETYLGGVVVAGGKLKEAGTTHWNSPNTGATNETGFFALPGGYRYDNGSFYLVGNNGSWWSATENDSSNAWHRYMNYNYSNVDRGYRYKEYGFSVRCIRD